MADLIVGEARTVWADLPAGTPASATLVGPSGTSTLLAAPSSHGAGRYSSLVPAAALALAGAYTLTWADATLAPLLVQRPLAGSRAAGTSLWDLRLNAAAGFSEVVEGVVGTAQAGAITDPNLLTGAGVYTGRYLIFGPEVGPALAGVYRRVSRGDGPRLEVVTAFPVAPAAGTRYALLLLNPLTVDRAIRTAFDSLTRQGRVPLRLGGLALAENTTLGWFHLTVPAGLTHLDTVWDGDGKEVPGEFWALLPGRKLVLDGDLDVAAGDLMTLRGSRDLAVPVWDDGTIEIESEALEALATKKLLASRAAGTVLDPQERLRRSLVADEAWQRAQRTSAGRMPPGSVEVID